MTAFSTYSVPSSVFVEPHSGGPVKPSSMRYNGTHTSWSAHPTHSSKGFHNMSSSHGIQVTETARTSRYLPPHGTVGVAPISTFSVSAHMTYKAPGVVPEPVLSWTSAHSSKSFYNITSLPSAQVSEASRTLPWLGPHGTRIPSWASAECSSCYPYLQQPYHEMELDPSHHKGYHQKPNFVTRLELRSLLRLPACQLLQACSAPIPLTLSIGSAMSMPPAYFSTHAGSATTRLPVSLPARALRR